jgi:hypothetical protein
MVALNHALVPDVQLRVDMLIVLGIIISVSLAAIAVFLYLILGIAWRLYLERKELMRDGMCVCGRRKEGKSE